MAGGAALTRAAGRLAIVAVAAFVLLHLPLSNDPTWRHEDEHRYTDAAIRMLAANDLATPRTADGTPRFHKPLLTYWALAASFRVAGVGLAPARMPSLLAIVLLAWLTWRTALVWFGEPVVALLAVVILLGHPETAQLACRATPDALLVLFLTASLLGVARLATDDPLPSTAARQAWIGAGLGVATKGLPGLLGIGWGAIVLRRPRRILGLLRPGAIALGMALAIAGTAPSWLRHGDEALFGLYADQVGGREIVRSFGSLVRQAGRLLGGAAIGLLPWTVLLAAGAGAVAEGARRHAVAVRFALGWAGLLVPLAAPLAFVRPRYLAPTIPLLAVLSAGLLALAARRVRAAARGALGLLAAVGVVVAAAGWRVAGSWTAAGALVALAGGAALRRTRRAEGDAVAPLLALGFVWLLAGGLFRTAVRPTLCESPVPAMVRCLDAAGADGATAVVVGEVATLASDLRLASGGRLDPGTAGGLRELARRTPAPAVVLAGDDVAPRLREQGWRLHPCGREVPFRWTAGEWWQLIRSGDRERLLSSRARGVFLATPDGMFSRRRADHRLGLSGAASPWRDTR